MKIMVNYTENEIINSVNTFVDSVNVFATVVGSKHRIDAVSLNRVIKQFADGTFDKSTRFPAGEIKMDSNTLSIDIKDEACLDFLKFALKLVNVASIIIGGLRFLTKLPTVGKSNIKEMFDSTLGKWKIDETSTRYVVANVEYEGMHFHVTCANDGYNKRVHSVTSDSASDAAIAFEEVLFNLYDAKVKEFDDTAFKLTKEEADKKAHEW